MTFILSLDEGRIKSTRDYQRQRVYNAERKTSMYCWNAVSKDLPTADWQTLLKYVADMNMKPWWKERFGRFCPTIHVTDGRRQRRATGGWGAIHMPKWSRSPLIICHEIAHAVGSYSDRHGPKFCEKFLWIVYHQMGDAAYQELRMAFISGGVEFEDRIMGPPASKKDIALSFKVKPKRKANPAAIEALRRYREEKKAASLQPIETA
jgi:putative metallohydrolase (TIGR04338 family)